MHMPELQETLCSLAEAVRRIKDGTRITFGGMSLHNHPMAFIYELIRQGVKDLTIVGHGGADDVDILVGAGCVKRLEISYVGLEEFGIISMALSPVLSKIALARHSQAVSCGLFTFTQFI